MRRMFRNAGVSAGALLVVVATLVVVDARVRDRVAAGVSGAASPRAIADAGGQASYVAGVLLSAARDQSIDHAPMVIFVVAATVLVVFMLRL
jgi:hypothetical protein